jgi:phosphopantothenate-cysteine ligase
MAVLDYAPAEEKAEKTPSGREEWTLCLTRNPKVIKRIRELAPDACLVQFKLEVGLSEEELRAAAMESLRKNRSDMVVANDLDRIRGASHPAVVLNAAGDVLARPDGKGAIARAICDALQGATHCRAGFSRPVR